MRSIEHEFSDALISLDGIADELKMLQYVIRRGAFDNSRDGQRCFCLALGQAEERLRKSLDVLLSPSDPDGPDDDPDGGEPLGMSNKVISFARVA